MWIRNADGWYIYQLRGVCFVIWVTASDKLNALCFREEEIEYWLKLLTKWTGMQLYAESSIAL